MAALDFNVTSTGDCSRVKISDCSTFCVSTSYEALYLRSRMKPSGSAWVNGNANGIFNFLHASATSDTITGLSYVINGVDSGTVGITSTTQFPTFSLPLTVGQVNSIVFTVTDNQSIGNSTTEVLVSLDSNGVPEWYIFPNVEEDITDIPVNRRVEFTADDITTLDPSTDYTVHTLTDAEANISSFPDSVSYSPGAYPTIYTQTYTITAEGETATSTYRLQIDRDTTSCASQMTQTDITDVSLTITDPDGTVYDPVDITDNYTTFVPFYLYPEDDMDDLADFSTPGKWKFELQITKTVSGSTYILYHCIYVYIICDLLCKYNKALAKFAQSGDCGCSNLDLGDLVKLGAYVDGLKNAIACGDETQADRIIEVLEAALAASGCDC